MWVYFLLKNYFWWLCWTCTANCWKFYNLRTQNRLWNNTIQRLQAIVRRCKQESLRETPVFRPRIRLMAIPIGVDPQTDYGNIQRTRRPFIDAFRLIYDQVIKTEQSTVSSSRVAAPPTFHPCLVFRAHMAAGHPKTSDLFHRVPRLLSTWFFRTRTDKNANQSYCLELERSGTNSSESTTSPRRTTLEVWQRNVDGDSVEMEKIDVP